MKNKWLLTCALILLSSQTFASEYIACGEKTGDTEQNCFTCGTTCTARFDSSTGKMTISGTGNMNSYSSSGPWSTYKSSITSLKIEEGITNIGYNAFIGSSIVTLELANSVTTIEMGGLQHTQIENVIIGPDSQLKPWGSEWCLSINSYSDTPASINILCKGDLAGCQAKAVLFNAHKLITNTDYYKEYNSDGNLTLKYSDNGYEKYDKNGNILAKYDLKDNLIQSRVYDTDGSVLIYDKNGKIVGIQGKRILTVEEASALVNNNKNTFTIRYR